MASSPLVLALLASTAGTALALPRSLSVPTSVTDHAISHVGRVTIPYRQRQVISEEGFDVLEHLSGNSPYFNSPGVGLTSDLPNGCSAVSATYLIRHADIYANDYEYEEIMSPFIYKLGNFSNKAAFGDDSSLAFLVNWTSPIDDPKVQISQVTDTGKEDARALGALIADRYDDIVNSTGTDKFRIWTASAARDEDTSQAFAQGFNSSLASIELVTVYEGEEQAANTLTPHDSCTDYDSTVGSDEQDKFIATYAPAVARRLNGLAGGSAFNWTADDVFGAQALCGYDTVIRNMTVSGFCKLFSESEWLSYEYANDLNYHRSLGYGNEFAPTLGYPWLAASTRLLAGEAKTDATNSSAGKQQLYISFTHREEPPYVITALGLFNETNATMPVDHINYERSWKTSQILPFLANVALERISCNATQTGNGTKDYIRALVNSAPIPIPGCADGPDGSCAVANFTKFVADREKQYGGFTSLCGLDAKNATSTLGFYEGAFPANGAAIETADIALNGTDSNVNKKKIGGGGSGGKTNNTNTSGASPMVMGAVAAGGMRYLVAAVAVAAGALLL